jgi:sugar/nucleoside kinase (ribokinase family)
MNQPSILVVGSVAYDTVETPFGRAERVLGGSASFFSVAASFFVPVKLVAVVGDDFEERHVKALAAHNIDMDGLQRAAGRTFFWEGKYSFDLNARDTVRTDLNVFEAFRPRIPEKYRRSSHVFLGNIDPVLQMEVLDQVETPRLVALDTMNYWIKDHLDNLRKVLRRVDVLLINDAEARQLSGEWNIVKAARAVRAMGPRDEGSFGAPAYPLEEVFDPTGAGDTFAGGFLGYLAAAQVGGPDGRPDGDEALRRAVVMGSTLASFCVEAFSLDRLLKLTRAEIDERFRLFKRLTHFDVI